ncbi:MAG: glycosyltransferase family 2 protein [Candidatus Lokiarchaeia archaeon]
MSEKNNRIMLNSEIIQMFFSNSNFYKQKMTLENLILKKPKIDKVEDFHTSENLVQKGEEILTSIVIPLYNEENSIKDLINRIPNHDLYEIIIVDDGSTDNSVKRIKEITNREIKIIHHEKNQGYGAALLTGFKHATGDIIITMDSDGQHNPEEIPYLIKPIINNQADVVVGSRYLGKFNYKYPLYARVGAYFIKIFFRMIFLQRIHDNQCGFRAFKKDINKILGNIRNTGMGFSTELLFTAAFNQLKILETPISANPRQYGTSHVNLIRILRSVSSCILYYILRKLEIDLNRSFLNKTLYYFYKKIKIKSIYNQKMTLQDIILKKSQKTILERKFNEVGNELILKEVPKESKILDLGEKFFKIIITIPAYNEEKSIGKLLQEINLVMDRTNWYYQILVLDDGSTDNTKEIAIRNGAKVISNKTNLGLAKTFRREMEICKNLEADIIVHIDADGQYPPRYIPMMIENVFDGNDLVLGSRFGKGIYYGSICRKLGNLFFAKFFCLLLRKKIHDTTTGFRAFTKEIAQLPIKSKFTYTQEQLIRAIRSKKTVKEIPIQARKTRKSRLFKNILEYFYRAAITFIKIFI